MTGEQMLLRVVVFQDGDAWIAQCLDYDICAQGPNLDAVRKRFNVVMAAEIDESSRRNGAPLSGIGPAPQWLQDKWQEPESTFSTKRTFLVMGYAAISYEMALAA